MSEYRNQRKKDPSRLLGTFTENGYEVSAKVPRGDQEKLEWFIRFSYSGQVLFELNRSMKDYPGAQVSDRDQADMDRFMLRLLKRLPPAHEFSGVTFIDLLDEFNINVPENY